MTSKHPHTLLRRQLKRHFGESNPTPDSLTSFIDAVDAAYRQSDEDRLMLERSLDLSSQELLQANSDLRAVLEGILDLFFRVDSEGIILDFRIGKTSSLVLPQDELLGRSIQKTPNQKTGKKFDNAIREVNRTKQSVMIGYSVTINSQEQFFSAHFLPLRHDQIAVVIVNTSEAKQAETRELELQSKLAASQRMESLGLLAGGVAHDLNNILGPIVAYPDLIIEDLGEHPTAIQDLLAIKGSALRAAAVIQDLLTLARRGVPQSGILDLAEALERLLGSPEVQKMISQYPTVSLETHLSPQLPRTRGSLHHLGQAVINLLLNAFEATPEGGAVTLATSVTHLDRPIRGYPEIRPGRYLMLQVSDTGEGVADEDLEHIFEPFYSKKRMGRSGSGLGLAVVWGVAKDFNGYVEVTSGETQGTTFCIFLPCTTEIPMAEEQAVPIVGGSEAVLVVDDVEAQRDLAVRLLRSLGYSVSSCSSGREAIVSLRRKKADLLVLDMVMEEDFDGLDTWRAARAINPRQRGIIASGFAETSRVTLAQEEGAGLRIQKPYSRETLALAVRQELDRTDP